MFAVPSAFECSAHRPSNAAPFSVRSSPKQYRLREALADRDQCLLSLQRDLPLEVHENQNNGSWLNQATHGIRLKKEKMPCLYPHIRSELANKKSVHDSMIP